MVSDKTNDSTNVLYLFLKSCETLTSLTFRNVWFSNGFTTNPETCAIMEREARKKLEKDARATERNEFSRAAMEEIDIQRNKLTMRNQIQVMQ